MISIIIGILVVYLILLGIMWIGEIIGFIVKLMQDI